MRRSPRGSRPPPTTTGRGWRSARTGAARLGGRIVATDDGRENEMKEPDEEVRDPEQHGVVAEGARHRQGDDEHRAHRGKHREPNAALVDVRCARQPGVPDPGPPERRQNEHPAEDPVPGRVVRQPARDLGHREHEDQVEEELERGYLCSSSCATPARRRTRSSEVRGPRTQRPGERTPELEVAGRRRLDRLLHGREQTLADQDLARGRLDAEP